MRSRYASNLARVAAHVAPDVIHTTTPRMHFDAIRRIANRNNVPLVYEVRGFHSYSEAAEGRLDPGSARYFREVMQETAAMRGADVVVTLCEAMRADIVSRGIDEGDVHVVPNAVDANRFSPVAVDAELRRRLGIQAKHVVGYITNVRRMEGLDILLDAVSILRRERFDIAALIVGDGTDLKILQDQASRLRLGENVVFTGRVPHTSVAAYYSLIDVFVVPRRSSLVCRTVTPLKPFEAMAMQRVVLVSDLPALREMVMDGVTGHVFRPDDPQDLAEKLKTVVSDPARMQAVGARARDWVVENRNWTSNAKSYSAIYEQALARRRGEGGRRCPE